MRTGKRAACMLILAVLAFVPARGGTMPAPARTAVRAYTGPAPFVEPACYITATTRPSFENLIGKSPDYSAVAQVGGACIGLEQGERSVRIRIDDRSELRTAGTAYFRDASGHYIRGAQVGFCETARIAIPRRAASLVVAAEASSVWCVDPTLGEAGPATTGEIRATFVKA
jgi:hypothetical protein